MAFKPNGYEAAGILLIEEAIMGKLRFVMCWLMAQGFILGLFSQEVAWAGTPKLTPLSGKLTSNPPMDKLELRMRQQFARIHREARLGKLTKDQVKALGTQVEAIRKTEIADMKQNGSKILSDAQIYQLNQQLDTLSKSIPVR